MKGKIRVQKLNSKHLTPLFNLFKVMIHEQFPEYNDEIKHLLLHKKKHWSRATYSKRLANKSKYILGAFDDKKLIAYLDADMPIAGVGYCSWLVVHPDHQRQGIGTKLLQKWEEDMKKKYTHLLYLNAPDRNLDYYKKLGFEYIGLMKKAWFGVDLHYFSKHIQAVNRKSFL